MVHIKFCIGACLLLEPAEKKKALAGDYEYLAGQKLVGDYNLITYSYLSTANQIAVFVTKS